MAGKADFTEEEWEQLRKGATGAGLLVSVSDRSFLDSLKEASSFAKYLLGSRESDSQLVRELASEHGTGFGAVATPPRWAVTRSAHASSNATCQHSSSEAHALSASCTPPTYRGAARR